MSYFNNSKDAAYSKLEYEMDYPPAYYNEPLNNIPSIPETTYSSRFEEQIYPTISNDDYERRFHRQNMTPPPLQSHRRRYCKLVSHISFILGLALVVVSIIFKFLSRSHISQAIEQDCPVNCVTTCYRDLPFYHPTVECDSITKSSCDLTCYPVGIETANTYGILFLVFVVVGGLLVVVQIVYACLAYCCFDYCDFKKQQQQQQQQHI
jgi:hypothetical protein